MGYYTQYIKLTKLINNKLKNSDLDTLVFELEKNLEQSIYSFSYEKLICIVDHRQFLYEVYYKILDRVIDKPSFQRLYKQLKEDSISKESIIKNIANSNEAKLKKTFIIYDK